MTQSGTIPARRQARAAVALTALAVALAGFALRQPPATPAAEDSTAVRLRSALAARLALMPEVARSKWEKSLAIEDLPREAAVVARFTGAATTCGAAADFAQAVIRAQIEAGKTVQRDLLEKWRDAGPDPGWRPRDLADELRPEIDRATAELVAALCAAESAADGRRRCRGLLRRAASRPPNVSRAAWREACAPWVPLRGRRLGTDQ